MQIAYFDESGDDGNPGSSPLFALSGMYLHLLKWKESFERILDFRRAVKRDFKLPVKLELHTKSFLWNKNPYRPLNLPDKDRVQIIGLFCDLVAGLELRIVNVVIVKPRILKPEYDVLDIALKYSLQRIENDLNPAANPDAKLLVITDEGRVGKMRKTARRIQRFNPIPSKFGAYSYQKAIRSLIEDPLPKPSKESYLIQLADLVAFVTYQYGLASTGVGAPSARLAPLVTPGQVSEWMDRLVPSLNLSAAPKDKYGVKFHPE
jgi:hypothetical protein